MTTLIVLIALVGAIWLAMMKAKQAKSDEVAWPVRAKRLMRDDEMMLLTRLEEALPTHRIFSQVALSQFIGVASGKEHQWARNKIFKKVADFVICDSKSNVIAVVEMDGLSHDRPSRQRSDNDKESAVAGAGIKLVRINSKALPKGVEIRALIGVGNEQRKVA